jgi:hypothetical protein
MATKIKGEAIKEGSMPLSALKEKLCAYPVEYYEGPEREFKVVELGGEKLYIYLGEISIPSDMEVEGVFLDPAPTEYYYQESYEGVLQEGFGSEQGLDINLYVGNDKYGYTSLKIEPSEDPNNLKWFYAVGLGMTQEGPGGICFAYNTKDWSIHYKANSFVPCNIKVYFLFKAQKLDVNLIPQEISRKEDIIKEVDNHKYPTVTVDADTKTYSGQLGSKYINIDINITDSHCGNDIYDKRLYLQNESDSTHYRYQNDYIMIIFNKNNNRIVEINLLNPIFTFNTFDLEWLDYKNCTIPKGMDCRVYYSSVYYPAILDYDDFVTTLINGKYLKYKLNRETHLLELKQEIDLNSIEGRADWNAQEGEAGYIENKPYKKFNSSIEKYEENSLVFSRPEDEAASMLLNYKTINGYIEKYHELYKLNGKDFEFREGTARFTITYSNGMYYLSSNRYNADDLLSMIENKELSIFFIIDGIDDIYLTDNVIKTTPQTLSDDAKNQVKENLGISMSTPDWNAQPGDAGYIENKPFYGGNVIRTVGSSVITSPKSFTINNYYNAKILNFRYYNSDGEYTDIDFDLKIMYNKLEKL